MFQHLLKKHHMSKATQPFVYREGHVWTPDVHQMVLTPTTATTPLMLVTGDPYNRAGVFKVMPNEVFYQSYVVGPNPLGGLPVGQLRIEGLSGS